MPFYVLTIVIDVFIISRIQANMNNNTKDGAKQRNPPSSDKQ